MTLYVGVQHKYTDRDNASDATRIQLTRASLRRVIGHALGRSPATLHWQRVVARIEHAHVFRARAPPRVPLVQRRGIGRRAKSQKCGAEKAQDSCNGLPPSGTSLRAEREESSSMSQPRRLAAFAFVAGLVSAPPAWAWHIAGRNRSCCAQGWSLRRCSSFHPYSGRTPPNGCSGRPPPRAR